MITRDGYSKDPTIRPEGIVVTWGQQMIAEKGGLFSFIKFFERCMKNEETVWLQKCKNKPRFDDLLYVYISVCNRIYYRCIYGGYETGEKYCRMNSWSSLQKISWNRILLGSPIVKAPIKIIVPGFQGFRYCTKLF